MSDNVKIALIVAAGIVVAVALYSYLSPYQTCVRGGGGTDAAKVYCARNSN